MGNGAPAADLRREDEACAQERHRNVRKIEIELNPRLTKKAPARNLRNSRFRIARYSVGRPRATSAVSRTGSMSFLLVEHSIFGICPPRVRSGFFPDPCRYIKPLCNEWIALSIIDLHLTFSDAAPSSVPKPRRC